MSPIPIEHNEWWHQGCIIQKNDHPRLLPYHVFEDTEDQRTVGTCYTFTEAKKLAEKNKVEKYKHGYKAFL